MSHHKHDEPLQVSFNATVRVICEGASVLALDDRVYNKVATKCMLTMGGFITSCTVNPDKSGVFHFNHRFEPIKDDENYRNQAGRTYEESQSNKFLRENGLVHSPTAKKIKDSAIMWIYTTEDPHKDEGKTVRYYLIGTAILDLRKVLEISAGNSGSLIVDCHHNFCKTYAKVILSSPHALSETDRRNVERSQKYMSENMYQVSHLSVLESVTSMIRTQQTLLQLYCARECQQGRMTMSDEMAGDFVSLCTFLQLYGACVSFTDMSYIVKERVAVLPYHMAIRYFFMAANVRLMSMKDIVSCNDVSVLSLLFRDAISAQLADSKQAEYFSDYCLNRVEKDNVANLDEGDHGVNEKGERWFKRKINESVYKFFLTMTEDQRQVCAGDGLDNRMGADDCETLITLAQAALKTFADLYSYLEKEGVVEEVQEMGDESNINKLEKTRHVAKKLITDNVMKTVNETEKMMTLIAIVTIMNKISFTMKLAIGSANAAAVGAPPSLSGHCYGFLECDYKDEKTQSAMFILEGTNWTDQRTKGMNNQLTAAQYESVNQINQMLLEITKIEDVSPSLDVGKVMSRMAQCPKHPEFYLHVFAYGSEVQLARQDQSDTKSPMVYGLTPEHIISGKLRSPKTMNYSLLCDHLSERGPLVDSPKIKELKMQRVFDSTTPSKICSTIVSIAMEEEIPPWSKKTWENVTERFLPCSVIYKATKFQNASGNIRIVFTHQLVGKTLDKELIEKFNKTIQDVLVHGKTPKITKIHLEKYFKDTDKRQEEITKLASSINEKVAGIQTNISVEKIFLCMECLVCVCTVKTTQLEELQNKLKSWIDGLHEAKEKGDKLKHMEKSAVKR